MLRTIRVGHTEMYQLTNKFTNKLTNKQIKTIINHEAIELRLLIRSPFESFFILIRFWDCRIWRHSCAMSTFFVSSDHLEAFITDMHCRQIRSGKVEILKLCLKLWPESVSCIARYVTLLLQMHVSLQRRFLCTPAVLSINLVVDSSCSFDVVFFQIMRQLERNHEPYWIASESVPGEILTNVQCYNNSSTLCF